MSQVLIQQPLAPEELRSLQAEFPEYSFVLHRAEERLPAEKWNEVEVLFGNGLGSDDLAAAQRLRWVHVSETSLEGLPIQQIEETSNLIVTNTKDPDVHQAGELALGLILSFGKNFFEWNKGQEDPKELWASPYRSLIWSLRGRTLLQVGLGQVGSEIARLSHLMGMRVWGIDEQRSFHPNCQRTYDFQQLTSLLPAADIVSIAIPRGKRSPLLFKQAQLELMKTDSLLLIQGSEGAVDEKALATIAESGKLRGIAIDGRVRRDSPLWGQPEVLITPEIAPCPQPAERLQFKQFYFNFRRYVHSDFESMKNLVR